MSVSYTVCVFPAPGQVRVKEVCGEEGHWHLVQELVSGGRVTDR